MTVHFYQPGPAVAGVFSLMVYHSDYRPGHAVERFLPDGGVELVITLTDDPQYLYDNESLSIKQTCTGSWFSGVRRAPISISAGLGEPMLVVSLVPASARRVVGHPMHLFADQVVDADAVFGSSMTSLRERLMNANSVIERFAVAERWLVQRANASPEPHPVLVDAAASIANAPTLQRVDALARRAGVSAKHLAHLFTENIGVSPKRYQRIHRFQQVVAMAEGPHAGDWARIAYECGFSDQSHLIAEFRTFSGLTPTEYARQKGGVLNYVPVPSR